VTDKPFDFLSGQIDPQEQSISSAAVKKLFLFIQLNTKNIGNLLSQNLVQILLFFTLFFKVNPFQNSLEFLTPNFEISSHENLFIFIGKTHRIQTGKSVHLNRPDANPCLFLPETNQSIFRATNDLLFDDDQVENETLVNHTPFSNQLKANKIQDQNLALRATQIYYLFWSIHHSAKGNLAH
jgi:hypothetical protein